MPAAKRELRSYYLLYGGLAVLFAIALTYRIRDTVDRGDELLRGHEIARLPFDIDLPGFTISDVRPEAAAAGLMIDDRIVAVAGRPTERVPDLFVPLRHATRDDELRVAVERLSPSGPVRRDVTLRLEPMRESRQPSAYEISSFAVGNIALPYLSLALGFWVAAVRVRDRLAWLLLLLLLSLAEFVGGNWRTLSGRDDWFQPVSLIYQPLLANLWPLSMMLFGIYFPDRLKLDRRWPWAKWVVIAPVVIRVVAIIVLFELLMLGRREAAMAIAAIFRPTLPVVFTLHFVAIAAFFGALGYKVSIERQPDAQRRLRLLHTGAAVALTPLCIVAVLLVAGVAIEPWVLLPVIAILFIFPATMAYVIVVERAMDVRLVIRQGVQYLLARGTILVIQLAVSASIIIAVAAMRGDSATETRVLLMVVGLAAILLIGRFAERLRHWIDRRFFREAYNAEQILSELANRVRTMVETRPLLETVAHQISSALHVPRLAILLNGGNTLESAYAVGYAEVPTLPVSEPLRWDEAEPSLRNALGAELVLPLASNQKLLGVMSLGPKQSQEPFTSNDIRLLDAVAAQTGLAIHNSRLTAEIAAEVANREKARRELEIAREVQERLFPQEYPPVPGLEYAGACRPALGVGGDYYDFVPLGAGQLGIAIGDVSGKGIPAALLMATLRAYLRAQTVGGEPNLPVLMSNLNQLVYESSAPNRYATFFYAHYDATSGMLRYVNAGHNPPMLLRASSVIERLDVGGPVIGLMPGLTYQEAATRLQPADMLVAFTDGISEAMNAAAEEWGEDRVSEVVQRYAGCPPPQLIARIIESADGFVAGAPQHDDMTVVVVKRV